LGVFTVNKRFYISVSNVLGSQNVFEYANNPDNAGFIRKEIIPTADRFFFFVGGFGR
jgi:hypothetical protein